MRVMGSGSPSFRRLLLDLIASRPIDHPVWSCNSKLAGRALAQLADVPAPELLAVGDIDRLAGPAVPAVVKPNHGCASNGVWLLRPAGRAFRLIGEPAETPKVTWPAVVRACLKAEQMRHPNPHERTRGPWLIEEAVHRHRRPIDWKAFCIGGRVACWRQMGRSTRGKVCKGWTREFEPAALWVKGGEHGTLDESLPGPAYRGQLIATAEAVAALVPGPFIRVDLYEADGTVLFGEITPNPGDGAYRWTPEWDQRMGRMWAETGN